MSAKVLRFPRQLATQQSASCLTRSFHFPSETCPGSITSLDPMTKLRFRVQKMTDEQFSKATLGRRPSGLLDQACVLSLRKKSEDDFVDFFWSLSALNRIDLQSQTGVWLDTMDKRFA